MINPDNVVLVTSADWDELKELCDEIWYAHRDPEDSQYNECEQFECRWCSRTSELLGDRRYDK